MFEYRDYQADLHNKTFNEWGAGNKNVLLTSSVGSGKTVLISNITHKFKQLHPSKLVVVIAHRQELVSQLSMSLAENDIEHNIIAARSTVGFIQKRHVRKFKRSYFRMQAPVIVASVNTIINRDNIDPSRVGLWIIDEAHHILSCNTWGRAIGKFPNALGLGVTATPERADGKGLGREYDGVFDVLIENTMSMGELIKNGSLTKFKIYAPPSSIDLSSVNITPSGDFSKPQVSKAALKSTITGDVVEHYLKLASGKLGVTFVPDIEVGEQTVENFKAAGVPCALITANTPDKLRAQTLDDFEARRILQIVNVDILGEGFNLPSIEVISFARPTASYGLYVQQFGRVLRLMAGKSHGIIIDHVGNVLRHGLPTQNRFWTLERKEKTGKSKVDPDHMLLKSCRKCLGVYEAFHTECPYCGNTNIPDVRSSPKFVDGDLTLLDFSSIDELHKEISRIDSDDPALPIRKGSMVCRSVIRRHNERKEAQEALRLSMAKWSTHNKGKYNKRERQKLFFIKFKIDVLTAQTLDKKEAEKLKVIIDEY